MIIEPAHPLLYAALALVKRLALLPRSLRMRLFRLTGKAAESGEDFCMYYLGEQESLGYLKQSYFSQASSDDLGAVPLWAFRSRVRELRSLNTVLVAEVNRLLDAWMPRGGFQSFPWIKQKIRLRGGVVGRRRGHIEEKYGRKTRKHRYRYRLTDDRGAIERFFDDLYVPYILSRFGETAHPRGREEMRAAVRRGFLMEVLEQDQVVSAIVCSRSGDTVRVVAGGLAPDYEWNLRRGASSACDYFLLKWSQEHGIATIDYLRSRPNLGDGVYQYKKSWGAAPEKDSWPHTSLWMFVPDGMALPQVAGNQLVWRNRELVAVAECLPSMCR